MVGPVRRPVTGGAPEGSSHSAKKAAAKPVTADAFTGVQPVKKSGNQETRTLVTKNTIAIQTTTKKAGGATEVRTEVHTVRVPSPHDKTKAQATLESVKALGGKWIAGEGGRWVRGAASPLPAAAPLQSKAAPASPQGKVGKLADAIASKSLPEIPQKTASKPKLPPLPTVPPRSPQGKLPDLPEAHSLPKVPQKPARLPVSQQEEEAAEPMKRPNLRVQIPGQDIPRVAERRKQTIDSIRGQRPSPKENVESPESAKTPHRTPSPMDKMAERRASESDFEDDDLEDFEYEIGLAKDQAELPADARATSVPDITDDAHKTQDSTGADFFSEFGDLGKGLMTPTSVDSPQSVASHLAAAQELEGEDVSQEVDIKGFLETTSMSKEMQKSTLRFVSEQNESARGDLLKSLVALFTALQGVNREGMDRRAVIIGELAQLANNPGIDEAQQEALNELLDAFRAGTAKLDAPSQPTSYPDLLDTSATTDTPPRFFNDLDELGDDGLSKPKNTNQ